MEKIKIIVDSGSSISPEVAKKYNMGIIYFKIHIDGETYTDQIDIKSEEFFDKLGKSEEKVTTSIPGVGEFTEMLNEYINEGYNKILCFSIGSSLSGMNNMMNLAKNHIENKDVTIDIIDTEIASLPIYFIATKAAKSALAGKSYQEIYKEAIEDVKKANVFVRVDTLDYLVKGGRLPKSIGKVASLMKFTPIFTMKEGEIKIAKRVIGKKKSFKEMAKILKEKIQDKKEYILAIGEGNSLEEIKIIKELLKDEIKNAKLFKEMSVPPVFGVHLGPKSLLVSVVDC
ncbi:DegV family protein [Anaerococcus ihuae]|uniref:DegV family protein n=1 Tax=Anaerococcus ihuae TaxID=2899519 RepID=UPI001F27CF96|nr:DegV family protein [Anaerococcus ihuae]